MLGGVPLEPVTSGGKRHTNVTKVVIQAVRAPKGPNCARPASAELNSSAHFFSEG
jgi:hypothetical protein